MNVFHTETLTCPRSVRSMNEKLQTLRKIESMGLGGFAFGLASSLALLSLKVFPNLPLPPGCCRMQHPHECCLLNLALGHDPELRSTGPLGVEWTKATHCGCTHTKMMSCLAFCLLQAHSCTSFCHSVRNSAPQIGVLAPRLQRGSSLSCDLPDSECGFPFHNLYALTMLSPILADANSAQSVPRLHHLQSTSP
jgi:hypothetical protein